MDGQIVKTNRCFLPPKGLINYKLFVSEHYDDLLTIIMPDHTVSDIRNELDGFIWSLSVSCENLDGDSQESILLSQKLVKKRPRASKECSFKKERKTFQCSSCGKFFDNFIQLKNHKYQVHPSNYGSIKCEICFKTLKTKSILINHMLTHNKSSFSCTHCFKEN